MIHQRIHPDLDIEGCFSCKISGIKFSTVPGGTRSQVVTQLNQREKDLHRYREKRRAGEQPDGTTKEAMDRYDRKTDLWDRRGQDVADMNAPAQAKKIKRALTNLTK